MSNEQEEFGYAISVDDFDKTLLPLDARIPGTDAFNTAVSRHIQKDFEEFGGHVAITVDQRMIRVAWRHDPDASEPLSVAIEKLKRGEYGDAIRLLELLAKCQPDNPDILYNLGMALSDVGRLEDAIEALRLLLASNPNFANAHVALGVALARQKRHADAISPLRRALELDPLNPWAHRNLGACLLQLGKLSDGESHLRRAVDLNPVDQQALLGLAQVLHADHREAEADELYIRVIDVDSSNSFAEMARQARSRLAQESFREKSSGGIRPDAVMYLMGAMDRFEKMPLDELRRVAFEIAVLGQRGYDTNNPQKQYEVKSLPGRYSGLHMVCLMYVAFQMISPEHSVGFDLSREFEAAKSMRKPPNGG